MEENKNFETQAVRTQAERSYNREHSVPLYMTSSFVFEDAEQARAMFADEVPGNIYTRFSNPNSSEFIEKMALLEGAEDGFATASGMSAVFSSMAPFLNAGDHVLISKSVFGSTIQVVSQIFPKWGISYSYADIRKPETWEGLIQPNTKMIMVETPSNPALDLIDLEWLGKLANKHNILLNVDNCFPTPYLQQPIKWGAHIVTHSATKFIDGQGRAIGGIILGSKELIKEVRFFCRHTGPALSPFNAWIFSKSLETLALRMDRHCENALKLAQHLENHPEIEQVKYPFLPSHPQFELAKKQMKAGGGVVTFIVKGGIERGRKFLNALQMASHTANLGDSRTIITHPASTTHSKLTDEDRASVGILPGLIRVSAGLEHIDDIITEVEQALEASKA
ncbi:aminotransferase class I/II-fold pyridoxal phosphate-dependent enzyme [Cytophagaceae bacterium ABcell3]|nr:aminotransferase class I/II-fold pyridoxal phosphate-dependent enzyme [Cytophagaceae bacterium ABcell3]